MVRGGRPQAGRPRLPVRTCSERSGMAITMGAAAARQDAPIELLLQATNGVWDIFAASLGDRLGLYRARRQIQPATSLELATSTRLPERYVREWLEQQTVSGILASATRMMPAPFVASASRLRTTRS